MNGFRAMSVVLAVCVVSVVSAQPMPAVSNTLMLHLDAGSLNGTLLDGAPVTAWDGGGVCGTFTVPYGDNFPDRNITNPTAPTWIADGLNGMPVVRFSHEDGRKDVLRAAGLDFQNNYRGEQEWTFFFVLANVDSMRGLIDTAPCSEDCIRVLTESGTSALLSNQRNDAGGVSLAAVQTASFSADGGVVFSFTVNGDGGTRNWETFINGESDLVHSEGSVQRGVIWQYPQIGVINRGDANEHFAWFQGDIAEIIAFEGVLSETDRKAVETYLYAKYIDVPEPATMSLLALGGLTLLRRRR